MKRKIRLAFILLTAFFIVIQFFQPKKNNSIRDSNHLFDQAAVPDAIQKLMQNSCADCHSNQTNYPWYDRIAPVSWMVSRHIKEGKKGLNISEWGKASAIDRITSLDNIYEQLEKGKMPLKSYTLIHKKARLSEDQAKAIREWADNLAKSLAEDENKK